MAKRAAYDQFTGITLGSYHLDQIIEQHMWGPIFKASDKQRANYIVRFIDTPLASAHSESAADAHIVYLGRFQQEANRVSALQHPNILPLLDYGNYQGIPYLVYPYIKLVSLRAQLMQKVPNDTLAIGLFLDQIASALEYAHEHAVLHRNLSTNCIFVQSNKQMLIAEFGLMRMHELGQQRVHIETVDMETPGAEGKHYAGSTESCSPEQLLGRSVDTYTDIYALGAVLYRLLTGRPPFTGKTREEIIQQHLHAAVPSLKNWRPELSTQLDPVISKAMAKDPQQRFRTPGDLTQAYYRSISPDRGPTASINQRVSTDRRDRNISSGLKASSVEGKTPDVGAPFTCPSSSPKTFVNPKTQSAALWRESLAGIVQEASATAKQEGMSRRRLIIWAATSASGGIAAVGALLALRLLGSSASPTASQTDTGSTPAQTNSGQTTNRPAQTAKVVARVADMPANSAKTFPIENQKNPGIIIHLPDNRFVAFDSTCTHQSCAVEYAPAEKMLQCPCHNAVFDPAQDASVVSGPAPAPLTPIKITVNADGTITTA